MPRLNVMVSDADGIIFHIVHHTGIEMRCDGVHIIEIICGIVALKAVSPVNQNY